MADDANLDGQDNTDDDLGTFSEEETQESTENENSEESGTENSEGEDTEGGGEQAEGEEDGHINQEAVNKKIGKIVYERKLAEGQAAEEKQKRIAVEAKLSELTKVELPSIPPIPDYMDADFDSKMLQRDKIISQHATDAANKQALENVRLDNAKADADAKTAKIKDMINGFDEKTVEMKLDKKAMVESQNVVGSFIQGKAELARYLLSSDNAPLNVLYLSQNTTELDKISKMSETEAAVYIATKVAPEALKLKPKTTDTVDPHYSPKGGKGKVEAEAAELEGCTFV